MRTFAQIFNGKLHWKFKQDEAPEFAADILIVEITGVAPEPEEGWEWDSDEEHFIAPPPPDPALIKSLKIEGIKVAIQSHLDAQARALGYDDIKSGITYAEEPAIPKFQSEGRSLRSWRSKVWAASYQLLDEVDKGVRSEMTSDEVIAALPSFELIA